MYGVNDLEGLARGVESRITASRGAVTIDGFDGAGKSHLSLGLAIRLGLEILELDEVLARNRGCYVESIRYPDLARRIALATEPLVVEGVCVQKVLNRLQVRPLLAIYVRKIESDGSWPPNELVDPSRNPDDVIAERKELDRRMAWVLGENPDPIEAMPDTLRHEIIRYHHEYQPHLTADYVFDRVA